MSFVDIMFRGKSFNDLFRSLFERKLTEYVLAMDLPMVGLTEKVEFIYDHWMHINSIVININHLGMHFR